MKQKGKESSLEMSTQINEWMEDEFCWKNVLWSVSTENNLPLICAPSHMSFKDHIPA